MEVRGYVLERDAGQIKEGDRADVRIDAMPGRTFSAAVKMVEKIARSMEKDSPVKYFEVVLSLEETLTGEMKPGMAVHFEIIPGGSEVLPVIPHMAVFYEDTTAFAVVKDRGTWKRVKIEPGLSNRVEVVVQSGLEAGDVISLRLPDDVPLADLEEMVRAPRPRATAGEEDRG
jgi:multidrug efflux pump subunit AcrA (membrane-fusion protein)